MPNRTITAFYEDRSAAESAVSQLVSAGIPQSQINLHDSSTVGASAYTEPSGNEGFWASLKDLFVPDEDRYTYSEGVRRGGVLLSANISEPMVDTAVHTLEKTDAVDLDSRTEEWKRAGWSDYGTARSTSTSGMDRDAARAAAAPIPPDATAVPIVGGTSTGMGTMSAADRTATGTTSGGMSATGMSTAGTASAGTMARETAGGRTGHAATADGREEAIPIVEEQIRVGKREVDRGSVRIRSYVVETPVEESVRLRDESVSVERRSVDLPVNAGDIDPFKERTIEVVETDEEAVVAKTARVKEELVIRKDVVENTETIRDTVRHTEVEVEDTRGRQVASSSTADEMRRPTDPLKR